ncbi:MAG: hypothetical protein ACI92Z_000950 [Paracoccaceae bacterium]|jgi:hypothetical protein
MTLSLNEVETTAKKAARGAGHSWGLAEEAGRATRWLCAHGFDGCAALAALLSKDGVGHRDWAPYALSNDWFAVSGTLCSLRAGVALSDSAVMLKQGDLRLRSVALPMLLIPFAANAARHLGTSINLAWPGASITTDGTNVGVQENKTALSADCADVVRLSLGGKILAPNARKTRVSPQGSDWQSLTEFASLTYAPATEESRRLGAGGDLSDND